MGNPSPCKTPQPQVTKIKLPSAENLCSRIDHRMTLSTRRLVRMIWTQYVHGLWRPFLHVDLSLQPPLLHGNVKSMASDILLSSSFRWLLQFQKPIALRCLILCQLIMSNSGQASDMQQAARLRLLTLKFLIRHQAITHGTKGNSNRLERNPFQSHRINSTTGVTETTTTMCLQP